MKTLFRQLLLVEIDDFASQSNLHVRGKREVRGEK